MNTRVKNRYPAHIQAAIDRLRALGAVIRKVIPGAVTQIVFVIGKHRDLLKVPNKCSNPIEVARTACAKAEALCAPRHRLATA